MRTLRRDLLGKAATVSLVAVSIAGCSGAVERFGEPPYYTGNTQNQRAILNGGQKQPTYQDIVNGPGGTVAGLPQSSSQPVTTGSISAKAPDIKSAPLPAPVPTKTAIRPSVPAPAPVATLPAPEVARPAQTVSSTEKSWKGWTSAGGTRVQLRQGDDLNSVSRRYGVPVQALAAVNGIDDAKSVRAGQSIIVPTYVYAERNGSTSTTAGETGPVKLPAVSRNDAVVTGAVPTSAGSMPRPPKQPSLAQLSRGDVGAGNVTHVSTLPKRKPGGGERVVTTASISSQVPTPPRQPDMPSRVASAPSASAGKPALPQPALTKEAAPSAPIKTPAVVASVQEEVDVTTETFRWPVRGRIISDFGAKPGGGKNEGVNLAVPEGTPVKAADSGTVIYSGNELKGYGNLILVRHDEGWVTAYAHNSELKVKRGDTVRRGDVVALAGASGSVNQPQVHFELRKGNKPVDPLKHLPQR
ncbi:M23 family metallopeptidase [Labrenzia sp. 011]|uniref:M23 family metallopeptidase n=1 Tax=Labrenzia sp. 011 TaxID=2171494 RepID=UPI001AD8BC24|nr:M23 family metallopeptidase [Labrenzia sp. 011]